MLTKEETSSKSVKKNSKVHLLDTDNFFDWNSTVRQALMNAIGQAISNL